MKLKESTIIDIQGDDVFEKYETKINKDKLEKLYSMLSNLYRNVPGSIIREYTSNAWDSHKEAGKEKTPIYVKLHSKDGEHYLLVKDIGLGMSPETMKNIYFNYLDSTKEDSDDIIGCFGIGSKSALAYTHTFYINTTYSGKLYRYIFTKQSNGIPAGELLMVEDTEEVNGTSIRIPLKKEDVYSFHRELSKQLTYFPNVFVESDWGYFDNGYKIYEKPLFRYRPGNDLTQLHMCLGDVPYSIDWTELSRDPINLPVAIKFSIGELTPTPSRESIVYSKDSIKLINKKIDEVLESIEREVNDKREAVDSIKEYLSQVVDGYDRYISYYIKKDISIKVPKDVIKLSSIEIKAFKHLNLPTLSRHVATHPLIDYAGYPSKITSKGYRGANQITVAETLLRQVNNSYSYRNNKVFLLRKDLVPLKNKWLADKFDTDIYFIKSKQPKLIHYKNLLYLHNFPKEHWREIITIYQRLSKKYIEDQCPYYDDLVIDKDWKDEVEQERKERLKLAFERRKEEKKIIYYTPTSGYNKDYIWDKQEDTISNIKKLGHNIIYAETTDKSNLMGFHNAIRQTTTMKHKAFVVITVAKSFMKYFEKEPYMFEFKKFKKSNHPLLIKLATAYEIKRRLSTLSIDYYLVDKFQLINSNISNKLEQLIDIRDFYLGRERYYYSYTSEAHSFLSELREHNVKEDRLHLSIMDILEEVCNYIEPTQHVFAGFGKCKTNDYRIMKYLSLIMRENKKAVNRYWYLKNEYNLAYLALNKETDETEE